MYGWVAPAHRYPNKDPLEVLQVNQRLLRCVVPVAQEHALL
jgi:hypothetical protein